VPSQPGVSCDLWILVLLEEFYTLHMILPIEEEQHPIF
jgi:hypothetical protein